MSEELVTTKTNFPILNPTSNVAETLLASLGPDGLNPGLIDQIKVPGQGGTKFTIPTADGEDTVKELIGIIIAFKNVRAYWSKSMEEGGANSPPDCFSRDCITGVGDPGGACYSCHFNQWGTAAKGNGKACKEKMLVFLAREHKRIPVMLRVPVSSLTGMRKFFLHLADDDLPYWGIVTKFELKQVRSKGGIMYSEIVPTISARLTPEQAAASKAYADSVAPSLASVQVDATEEAE